MFAMPSGIPDKPRSRDAMSAFFNGTRPSSGVTKELEERLRLGGAADCCTANCWPAAAAFLAVGFSFNRLSWDQPRSAPKADHRRRATLPATVFLCGAMLGRAGRQTVLHRWTCWGGWAKPKPLLEAVWSWKNLTSPKWVPPEDQPATAACRI